MTLRSLQQAVLLCAVACQPKDGTTGTTEFSDTSNAEGLTSGDTSGAACDFEWLSIIGEGDLTDLGLTPSGHAITFGSQLIMDSIDAVINDLDSNGEVVRTINSMNLSLDYMEAGGVDEQGNIYTIFSAPEGALVLRKYDASGALVSSIDMGEFPYQPEENLELAVAPNGMLTITNFRDSTITRRNSDLAVVWERKLETVVRAANSAGFAIGTYGDAVVMLDSSGEILWQKTPAVVDGYVDLNSTGHSVIAGYTSDLDELSMSGLDPAGETLWSSQFEVQGQSGRIRAVSINADRRVIAVGTTETGNDISTVFIVEFSAGGELIGNHLCPSDVGLIPNAVRLDNTGMIRMGGRAFTGGAQIFVAAVEPTL
jgi:hypothetical protein